MFHEIYIHCVVLLYDKFIELAIGFAVGLDNTCYPYNNKINNFYKQNLANSASTSSASRNVDCLIMFNVSLWPNSYHNKSKYPERSVSMNMTQNNTKYIIFLHLMYH